MQRISPYRASLLISIAIASPLLAGQTNTPPNRQTQLSQWFAQLADRRPQVRDAATQNLMGMSAADLPVLHDLIAASRHISPAQADPLEEIVVYVAARDQLRQMGSLTQPFLGLSNPGSLYEQEDESENVVQVGVPISEPLYGFVGYRCLKEGDVILSIASSRRVTATPTWEDLLQSIKPLSPGDIITVRLLRSGRLMSVTFALDARPEAAGDRGATDDVAAQHLSSIIQSAHDDAEAYFDKQFRPLIEHDD